MAIVKGKLLQRATSQWRRVGQQSLWMSCAIAKKLMQASLPLRTTHAVCCCAVLCCAGGYVDFISLRDMTRYLASNNPSIQSNRKQLRTLGIYAARAAIALPWSGR
jgi:uncharacterized membrane protein